MHALHTQSEKQVAALSKKLRRLERRGKYEKALTELGGLWNDFDSHPLLEGLSELDSAEILLRCGSLIGFHGHNKQIQDAQVTSRDLLMESREKFLSFTDKKKAAECENYLALTYWRTGESNEAAAWVDESLSRNLPINSDTRLYAYVIKSLNLLSLKQYHEICDDFTLLENDFLVYADDFLKGNLYNNYGLALKNLGKLEKALDNLEIGKDFYLASGNKVHCGLAENNLAQMYRTQSRFQKAHLAVDNAARLFKQSKDKTREGFSFDTKALIYKAEARYDDALMAVEKAIKILRKSENLAYLAETCLTKSKILLYLDDFTAAVLTLIEAVDIARVQTGEEAAKRLIIEFEKTLDERKSPKLAEAEVEKSKLELVLPASLSNYTDYRGIRINNSYLENIGIKKDSLAVLAEDKISRGDLVAIVEIATGEISCGFYDADFGIACLERTDHGPLLFDEKDIKVLGKIVGVCNSRKDETGKMIVEALNLQNRN